MVIKQVHVVAVVCRYNSSRAVAASCSPALADVTRRGTQWSDRLHIDCRQYASCENDAPAPATSC